MAAAAAPQMRIQGWVYKRIPRSNDSDKLTVKRKTLAITAAFRTKFQRRWFDLQPENKHIAYYKAKPASASDAPAGVISLGSIVSVTHGPLDTVKERTPTEWVFNVHTRGRIYTLCAEFEDERDAWVDILNAYLQENGPAPSFVAASPAQQSNGRYHREALMDVVDMAYTKQYFEKSDDVRALILEVMEENILFNKCKRDEKMDLLDAFKPIEFQEGTVIIRQGERGDDFYIIEEGAVEVYLNQPTGDPKKFGDALGRGKSFGELALLYNTPRAATIRVSESCRLWSIDRATVRSTIAHFQTLRAQRNCQFLAAVAFSGRQLGDILTNDQLERLGGALESKWFDAGDIIVKQGDKGDYFYIIEEGEVDVHKSDIPEEIGLATPETKLVSLVAGQYFGEKALLSEDVRQATCAAGVASHGCRCLVLNREDFEMMLGGLGDILEGKKTAGDDSGAVSGGMRTEETFEMQDFDELRVLGLGAFGVVKLVQHRGTQEPYALKCLTKAGIVQHRMQEHTIRERRIMRMLDHPFVLKLHGAMQDERYVYFVLDLLIGGELFTHLDKKGALTENEARFYTAQVQQAFEHIHAHRIAYRDLKPENLVLDARGYITVVDFGLAKLVDNKTFTMCGTPDYLAPEMILNEGHDKSVDYWALGIFVFELVNTEPPFAAEDQLVTYQRVIDREFKIPKRFSSELSSLVKSLLKPQAKRLGNGKDGCKAIRMHKWFAKFDFDALMNKRLDPPIPVSVKDPLDASNFDEYDEEDVGTEDPPECEWNPDLSAQ